MNILVGGLVAATTLISSSFPSSALAKSHGTTGSFDPAKAEQVLSYGFDVISDRYLNPVTPATLAVEGLRGLGSIDPALAVTTAPGVVRLADTDRTVATFAAPRRDNAKAWADVAVELTEAARAVSPAVRAASDEQIYQAVFDSMLAKLDRFSRYAGYNEADDHRASRNGFGGVGIAYTVEDRQLVIDEVLKGSPADKAGLRPGDCVVRIDGQEVASIGSSRREFHESLRGPINSSLSLTLLRDGRIRHVSLKRGLVVPPTVDLETYEDGIARISISSFNQRTSRDVAEALEEAKDRLGRNLRGFILDLRGNPGGLLDQAVEISDFFLSYGRIVYTKGRHEEAHQTYYAGGADLADDLPMAILVDGKSASAAEIVAAALQDNGRAIVIGTTSYGKGTVQSVIRLPNNGEMTLTWSRFHSPSGYALQDLGVLPTVCTSGQSPDLNQALRQVSLTTSAISSRLALWRSTPLNDAAARRNLRSLCPPAERGDEAADIDVARRLLSDKTLYSRALQAVEMKSASRY